MSENKDEADLPGGQIPPVCLKPDLLLFYRGGVGSLKRLDALTSKVTQEIWLAN